MGLCSSFAVYDLTALQQADVLGTARHKIRSEIASLQWLLGSFQSKFNELASVGKLPFDILARIFTILAEDDPLDRHLARYSLHEENLNFRCTLHWMVVTHVCRHWREVAMSIPSLWRKPALHLGSKWFLEMLKRAESAPLHLVLEESSRMVGRRTPFSVSSKVSEQLSKHLDSVEVLILISNVRYSLIESLPLQSCTAPAPKLRTLEIRHTGTSSPITLRPDFLANHFPRLHELTLYCVDNSWAALSFQDLVRLTLEECDWYLSYDRILDVLKASPRLEYLKLLRKDSATAVSLPPRQRVRLPRLKLIALRGHDVHCAALLSALELPNTSSISLDRICSLEGYTPLISELNVHLSRDPPSPLHHLLISCDADSFALRAIGHIPSVTQAIGDLGVFDSDHSPLFTFGTGRVSDRKDARLAIRAVFSHIPVWHTVETILVRGVSTRALWDHGIAHLVNVKVARFEYDKGYNFADEHTMESLEHNLGHYLPRLETLELKNVDLRERCPRWFRVGSVAKSSQALLLSLLTRRLEVAPVQCLRLIGCRIFRDELWRLEAVVPTIEEIDSEIGLQVDGEKEECSDSEREDSSSSDED